MYPNIVSLAGFDEDGYYQNDDADILLNTSTGWFAAALIRANVAATSGVTARTILSNFRNANEGIELILTTTAPNILELTWVMGTGPSFVSRGIDLHPATCIGKLLMPWALWDGTNFIIGVNGQQIDTQAAATFANNTTTGMFLGRDVAGATTDLEDFAEIVAVGFINTPVPDGQAAQFASALYAASERLNDLNLDDVSPFAPGAFDYLISMQRQGHAGLQPTFANLGLANGGTFTLHATEDSALTLRTSPPHWACPAEIED